MVVVVGRPVEVVVWVFVTGLMLVVVPPLTLMALLSPFLLPSPSPAVHAALGSTVE